MKIVMKKRLASAVGTQVSAQETGANLGHVASLLWLFEKTLGAN